MKLTVFQSDKGDCLLLTGADGRTLLADGGMRDSYKRYVSPTLGKIAEAEQAIDLVYVSHIDQDHIAGILQMMDNVVAWRVYDYQTHTGNTTFRKPECPRPPKVRDIWHNAFHDQIQDNIKEIEDLLAANMKAFLIDEELAEHAEAYGNLVASKREALLLSHRVGPHQLNIPVNRQFDGGLIYVADPPDKVSLGGMDLHVIGPFQKDLKKLRDEWNEWLRKNQEVIQDIRDRARRDAELLHVDEGTMLRSSMLALATELGRRNLVTTPNLASLMLLVEEGDKTVLLTGDGHADDILTGLRAVGKLDDDGSIHVDVLKVQHHGSEHNIHADFCKAVTADHYVFCGNGAHHNPDLSALQAIIDSRLDLEAPGSPLADRPFKLWFNSSAKVTKPSYRDHIEQVEQLVEAAVARSQGRMKGRFLRRGSSFEITA
jgi:beta-lactamase superfamily II metal-dependent hydrolase